VGNKVFLCKKLSTSRLQIGSGQTKLDEIISARNRWHQLLATGCCRGRRARTTNKKRMRVLNEFMILW